MHIFRKVGIEMKLKIKTKIAKNISYGGKRSLNTVTAIVIHYTAGDRDTAKGEATYFAKRNERNAGAHFFVDRSGEVYKSVNMNRVAWSVGGAKYTNCKETGGGKMYGVYCNSNTISIELCDNLNRDPSWEQMLACRQLVQYIQSKCPNAKTIIRHFDITGKECPARMIGTNNYKWDKFKTFITEGYQFRAKVTKKAALRSSGKVTLTNKIGEANVGQVVKITKIVGNWGRLKGQYTENRYRWICLDKVEEIQ